jgi:hypothetical protein
MDFDPNFFVMLLPQKKKKKKKGPTVICKASQEWEQTFGSGAENKSKCIIANEYTLICPATCHAGAKGESSVAPTHS